MQEKNQWEVASQEYDHKLKEKMEHDKRRLQAWQKREDILEEEVQVFLNIMLHCTSSNLSLFATFVPTPSAGSYNYSDVHKYI